MKTKSATRELNGVVFVDTETGLGRMQLVDDDYARLGLFDGVQNGWKLKPVALPAFPTGTKALTVFDEASGLTFKFGAKGAVSFSGKVAGDAKMVSVNGSAQLLPYAYGENVLLAKTLVYVAPKSGLSAGFIKEYDLVFMIGDDGKAEAVGAIIDGDWIEGWLNDAQIEWLEGVMYDLRAPIPAPALNRVLATGLDPASTPGCTITRFDVAAKTISGAIAISSGKGEIGRLGANLRVTLMGSETAGGRFEDVCQLSVTPEGQFVTDRPEGFSFFRVRIEILEVVK